LGTNGSGTNSGPSREEDQVSSSTKVVCVDDSDDQGSLEEEFDDNGNVPNPTDQDNPIPHTTNNPVLFASLNPSKTGPPATGAEGGQSLDGGI
jgi:hypothetical protein